MDEHEAGREAAAPESDTTVASADPTVTLVKVAIVAVVVFLMAVVLYSFVVTANAAPGTGAAAAADCSGEECAVPAGTPAVTGGECAPGTGGECAVGAPKAAEPAAGGYDPSGCADCE
jgi:hypothetical protein